MREDKLEEKLIVIGLATFMRPKYLAEALESVSKLMVPKGYALHLVVVDNDEKGSAKPIVDAIRSQIPFAVTYNIEKERGFPNVKNNSIEEAIKLDADFIAFFDDDAAVPEDWLVQFLKTDADVVEGVADFILPKNVKVSPLIEYYYKVMKIKTLETGATRKSCTSTNVFFDAKLVRDWGLRFNKEFSVLGGSDVDFFSRAYKKGAVIKYSHLARVFEKVPETRANKWWLLRRWFRLGTSAALRYRLSYSYPVALIKVLIKSISRIIVGIPLLLVAPFFSVEYQARQLHRFTFGVGLLLGIFGVRYQEYKKIHGA